jgi:hypothetical protein
MNRLIEEFIRTLSFDKIRKFILDRSSHHDALINEFVEFAKNNKLQVLCAFTKSIDPDSIELDFSSRNWILNKMHCLIPHHLINLITFETPYFVENGYIFFIVKQDRLVIYDKKLNPISIPFKELPDIIRTITKFQEGLEQNEQ